VIGLPFKDPEGLPAGEAIRGDNQHPHPGVHYCVVQFTNPGERAVRGIPGCCAAACRNCVLRIPGAARGHRVLLLRVSAPRLAFRTLYIPKDREELEFGLGAEENERLSSLVSLYVTPFRQAWRVLSSRRSGLAAATEAEI